MARLDRSTKITRLAALCGLAACVQVLGTVGCSSDAPSGGGVDNGASAGTNDGDTAGEAGTDAPGSGGTGGAAGEAGDGGSTGSDLAPGTWDASKWDEAVWQ